MISETELCAMFDRLDRRALRQWVEAGLVQSAPGGTVAFDEADVARVRLIFELHYDLEVEEESLPVVLSLVDQIYDLRRSIKAIAGAIAEQPDEVRMRIAAVARGRLQR